MIVTFSVPFAHAKQRPRFSRVGGKVRTFTPKDTEDAEKKIRDAYMGASIRKHGRVVTAPAHVPVSVTVTVRRALPKSRPKRVTAEPDTVKFDIDNCVKEVLDALNGTAFFDDSQVTEVHGFKLDRIRDWTDHTYVTVFWEGAEDGTE